MCGIALIVSGIRIGTSPILLNSSLQSSAFEPQPSSFSVDDLKEALKRRGPDNLGITKKKLVVLQQQSKISSTFVEGHDLFSLLEDGSKENGDTHLRDCVNGGDDGGGVAELQFFGATLQLRGLMSVSQPFVDSSGNILVYNGEIFGGIDVGSDSNDGEVLMETLGKCCSCSSNGHTSACFSSVRGQSSVLDILSAIKGPWAIIYWQDSSKTLWFGRDAFGRRSLLVHWPSVKDSQFLLSSVSPSSYIDQSSDFEAANGSNENYWEELSCGIYSLSIDASKLDGCLVGEVKKHEWADKALVELIKWERLSIVPRPEDLNFSCHKTEVGRHNRHTASSVIMSSESVTNSNYDFSWGGADQMSVSLPAQNVLSALRKSLIKRTSLNKIFQPDRCNNRLEECVPVAVLFSGGLDSMILAALLDECLDPSYGVDLLNVSFDGQSAPDRISAKAGVHELRKLAPSRRWKLVEIDADLSTLALEMKHVMLLINPANTYMLKKLTRSSGHRIFADPASAGFLYFAMTNHASSGTALWLAARGEGWFSEGTDNDSNENQQRFWYKSEARIVLVGSGADEQCAGYGRHRTKYRCGSWYGLHEEMKLDMQRIWKRNMGRDDRCISDHGKEARFPFLDEDVIKVLLDTPLWEVANLDEPSGTGDKKILREVAKMLGLSEAATLPKRAIQFGSRIARESNRKNFGSNRAANQASAGSVVIKTE